MNTVTFSQKSSSFSAIRTLHQLVEEEATNNAYRESYRAA